MGGGGGGWFIPPEKLSSRSQTKCSQSQNCAFVYMRCFAKQTKLYFRNLVMYRTQTIELKICSNGIKQLRNNMKKYYVLISRVYERNISQNKHTFFIMHLINDVRPRIFVISSLRIGVKLQYNVIVIVSLFMKLIFRLNFSQNAGNSVSKP